MSRSHRPFDENAPASARGSVRDDILARHEHHLNPRSAVFKDPLTTTYARDGLARDRQTGERTISTLEALERDHGRAAARSGEIDHATPVLVPGGALQRTSPWSERVAYARAHPYSTPPRRFGLFDDVVGGSGRDRSLEGGGTGSTFAREARRDAAWRRTASAFGKPGGTSVRSEIGGAVVYRGYGDVIMGTTQSGMRDARVLEDSNGRGVERGFGGAATFKRFEKVNIFGDAFKKYVNTRKWDDPKGLSDYKALIASHENGTLAGRSQRAALEKDRASRRDAATAPTESLSAKHAATIRDMQETLRIRREKLNQVLSASTSSGLEEQLSRLSVEAEEHKRRREREKAAKKFLKPLTAAQLEAVQDALRAPSTQILASGSFVGQGALDATGKDIATLKTGTWLNDEVANFAIGLLSQRAINSMPKGETQPKVHFFSTFFINKLYQDSNMYDYSNVRRWTLPKKLKYDVLRCEKIFVPIHQSVHWVLAEIDTRKKRISYYDSLLGESGVAVKNLKRWLIDEAKNKLNEDWDPDEWIEAYPKDIPLQKNGCDCGVFMIKYADYLSAGAELAFSQKHMEYFRRRLVWDIVSVGVR